MARIRFGIDGIRYPADAWPLDPPGAEQIGRSLARYAALRSGHAAPVIVLARDTRPSSPRLLDHLQNGLLAQQARVINLGVATTPAVAYMTRRQDADLGVVISASHNPAAYNGIKVVTGQGLRLQREEEMMIEALLDEDARPADGDLLDRGQVCDGFNLTELYIDDHKRRCLVSHLGRLPLVLDCANGAAAFAAPEVFRRLGATCVVLNDGEPGHMINDGCGSEHVRESPHLLSAEVVAQGAAYGLAFDGDGDRLVVVDSAGRFYDGDDLLYALAIDAQARGELRGNAVVTTDMANTGLLEALQARGIHVELTGKGDKVLEAAMWSRDYLLGGEQSGNIIINDGNHTAADAIFTAVRLVGMLQQRGVTLAEWVAELVKRPQAVASVRVGRPCLLTELPDTLELIRRTREALALEGGRVSAWFSSSEPGVFKVMVEGGTGWNIDLLCFEALAICEALAVESRNQSGQAQVVQSTPPIGYASPFKREMKR